MRRKTLLWLRSDSVRRGGRGGFDRYYSGINYLYGLLSVSVSAVLAITV